MPWPAASADATLQLGTRLADAQAHTFLPDREPFEGRDHTDPVSFRVRRGTRGGPRHLQNPGGTLVPPRVAQL